MIVDIRELLLSYGVCVAPVFPFVDCKDLYPVACETWGQSGECDKNPGWMNTNCEKTCKQCTGQKF